MQGTTVTRVAVVGATGYAGQQLVRLLARHRGVRLTGAWASSGTDHPRRLPALARVWDGEIQPLALDRVAATADVAFLSLPEATTASVAPALLERGLRVIDLSGAFRLRDADTRARWYPQSPATLPDGVAYALPERPADRAALPQARLVACPGCYPTVALLALGPLATAGLLADDPVIVDAKSGISGAGKAPSERTHFSENHGSVAAYGVFHHRHAPEMAQELGREVVFVPHLVPLDRGILATIYARLRPGTSEGDIAACYDAAYRGAPFVRLTGTDLPEIKHVVHTNFCDIGWRFDPPTSRIVIVACLDNLLKGAAGQAVQNFNLACGHDETEGLA